VGRFTEPPVEPTQPPAEPTVEVEAPTATPVEEPTTQVEAPTAEAAQPTPTVSDLTGGGSGQLAFASDRGGSVQIWLVSLDGSEPEQLTDVDGGAGQPAWSPDGQQLVFTSPCSGEQETYAGSSLWLVNADGSGLEALPSSPEGDFDPAWSPDGELLAFTTLRNNDLNQIYLMKMSDRTVEGFTTSSTHEMQPSWSSEGEYLAFVAPSSGGATVYYRDLSDGKTEQFSRESDRLNSHPHWSLDGSYIIYTQLLGSGFPGMMSATLEQKGFDAQPLLAVQLQPSRQAVFSPDGSWLALESWPDGANHDIWIMTANASSPQQVTDDPAFDFDAAWRP
jgi:Tol biopolymer transport system component